MKKPRIAPRLSHSHKPRSGLVRCSRHSKSARFARKNRRKQLLPFYTNQSGSVNAGKEDLMAGMGQRRDTGDSQNDPPCPAKAPHGRNWHLCRNDDKIKSGKQTLKEVLT